MKKAFKFINPGRLVDGDLELILVKKHPAGPAKKHVPSYEFKMRRIGRTQKAGYITLRVGSTRALHYRGHIGYGVRPSVRRRGYATEILRLSLVEARSIGIGDVRLTCDQENIASAKSIIKNGGVLDEEAYMAEHGHVVQRYWISENSY